MGCGKRIKRRKNKKEEEGQMSSFKIKPIKPGLTFVEIGDYIINKLEAQVFTLDYNDVYEWYSTIDFRKGSRKYNILLVPEEDFVKCDPSINKRFIYFLFGIKYQEKEPTFDNLVRNIIITSNEMKLVN